MCFVYEEVRVPKGAGLRRPPLQNRKMPEKSARRGAALELLRELAQVLPVQGLPETAAESYGTIRAELERKGEMIGNNDLWIAVHAKAAGLTLVTNNGREFRRVRGLKVQNWAV